MNTREALHAPRRGWLRAGLLTLAATMLATGCWALSFPRSFYDDFALSDWGWVSTLGPYNEHLVRDYGALNLALSFLLAAVAVFLQRRLSRVALITLLVFAAPHFAFHLTQTHHFSPFQNLAQLGGLGFQILLPQASSPLALRAGERQRTLAMPRETIVYRGTGTLPGPAQSLESLREGSLEMSFIGQMAVPQAFLPLLRKVRGRIMNICSLACNLTTSFNRAYSAAKHGLEAFSDALRMELAPWDIRVCVVEPGTFATHAEEALAGCGRRPGHPAGRWGRALRLGLQDLRADSGRVHARWLPSGGRPPGGRPRPNRSETPDPVSGRRACRTHAGAVQVPPGPAPGLRDLGSSTCAVRHIMLGEKR